MWVQSLCRKVFCLPVPFVPYLVARYRVVPKQCEGLEKAIAAVGSLLSNLNALVSSVCFCFCTLQHDQIVPIASHGGFRILAVRYVARPLHALKHSHGCQVLLSCHAQVLHYHKEVHQLVHCFSRVPSS